MTKLKKKNNEEKNEVSLFATLGLVAVRKKKKNKPAGLICLTFLLILKCWAVFRH